MKAIRFLQQHEPRCNNSIAANNDDLGSLLDLTAVSVDIDCAGGKAFVVDQDFAHAAVSVAIAERQQQ